jgi:hypothetical protein
LNSRRFPRKIPHWAKIAKIAKEQGVKKLGVELLGNQLAYNFPTLLRLRKEIGPIVGANLDPFKFDVDKVITL